MRWTLAKFMGSGALPLLGICMIGCMLSFLQNAAASYASLVFARQTPER